MDYFEFAAENARRQARTAEELKDALGKARARWLETAKQLIDGPFEVREKTILFAEVDGEPYLVHLPPMKTAEIAMLIWSGLRYMLHGYAAENPELKLDDEEVIRESLELIAHTVVEHHEKYMADPAGGSCCIMRDIRDL